MELIGADFGLVVRGAELMVSGEAEVCMATDL